ncbi:MAG: hypothetical protein AB1390_02210 [Nitrospirota bacterium]
MADVLIRGISEKTLERLKSLAKQHNRSLQQELKDRLEDIAFYYPANLTEKASEIRKKLGKKGKQFSDSAVLLRQDRCR